MTKEDTVDQDASDILGRLNTYINLNEKDNDEALVYALAQLLHDRIQSLDMINEEKGKLVSDLIVNFGDFNKIPLAAHVELMRNFMESKDSTIH